MLSLGTLLGIAARRPGKGCEKANRMLTYHRRIAFEPLEDRRVLSVLGPEAGLFNLTPALFVENQGQWADETVRFLHQGNGASAAMTDAGIAFEIVRHQPGDGQTQETDAPQHGLSDDPLQPDDYITETLQFSAGFVGANTVVPVGLEKSEAVFHYFVGEEANWHAEVPGYGVVAYERLYDGIDLHTWGLGDRLKYEFQVAPDADWSEIAVRYDGIAGLSLAEDGSLVVDLGGDWGSLTDAAPYIYQVIGGQQVEVAGRFELLDAYTYTFDITGPYDASAPLIIDPELAWDRAVDDISGEYSSDVPRVNAVAVDGTGNIFAAGRAWVSDSFVASVTKLNREGTILWQSYRGGDRYDEAVGIAVDPAGNAYITGRTDSPGWTQGTPGIPSLFPTHPGGTVAFVASLSPSGNHWWSTYIGASGSWRGQGIAIDSTGELAVTGYTNFEGPNNIFLAKLFLDGMFKHIVTLGGSNEDIGYAIASDGNGNVFIAGQTRSTGWMQGGFNTTFNGHTDAFVVKLDWGGNAVWSTYLGGSELDRAWGIAVDDAGNVLVTGETRSPGWVFGGFNTVLRGARDAFVAKLSPSGDHLWSTYLGGNNQEVAFDIGVDHSGNALIAGWTTSPGWVNGGFDTTFGSGERGRAFLAKLSPTGGHLWSSYYKHSPTTLDVQALGITVDAAGNAVIAGTTDSWDDGDTLWLGPHAFVAKIEIGDRFEPNNSGVWAINLGAITSTHTETSLSIHNGTDTDWFRFMLSSPGDAGSKVEVLFTHAHGDIDARLYDNFDGSPIRFGTSTSDNETLSLDGLPPGTYYLEVYGHSGAINSYSLRITPPAIRRAGIAGRVAHNGVWRVSVSDGERFDTTRWDSWNPAVDWVDVLVADFTGNGLDDIAARNDDTGEWYVAMNQEDGSFTTKRWETWNPNVTWEDVLVGDFNGDGKDDLVARVGGEGGSGSVRVALSNGSRFNGSRWETWNPNVTWEDVLVGDFNGDERADLVARVEHSGAVRVSTSLGNRFASSRRDVWNPAVDWTDVLVGDFTGNGSDELIARDPHTGIVRVSTVILGFWITSRWNTWNPAVDWADVMVGNFAPPSAALHAAYPPTPISQLDLQPIVEEAVLRMPVDLEQVAFQVYLVDLPGLMLGRTVGNTIQIDPTAAGFGWYLGATDADFQPSGRLGELTARPGTEAVHRIDLLTTVMHEMGHLLGHEHAGNGLMQPTLAPGVRWLPADDEASLLAGEQSLLDDGALKPARLDAYFAALG